MSEAFKEIIRFLFEDVGLNRIEAYHDPRNPHSGDVMKKCGLLYEGTARQAGKNMQQQSPASARHDRQDQ